MMKNFDEMNAASKEMMDNGLKSFASLSQAFQTIATESAEYAKKSMEMGSGYFEKLSGVKSMDKAIEVQSEYAKSAYEQFVAQTAKMSDLYADLAKEAYKPFESAMSKAK
ncbi:MAG: Phasin [Phyllobacteriaceae bacterium]|nr:Phasin [Phyllobacteriaceae bacterium]MBA92931.1 Phasin [Phyllobacteriaceae bacterium]